MSDPIATYELIGRTGTDGDNPSRGLRFRVDNTSDDTLVRTLVDAASPLTYDGLVKQRISTEEIGQAAFEAEVIYGVRETGSPGVVEWSFEIGAGGQQHISQSLETVNSYGVNPPNFKGAIGVRRDGNGLAVDGIDLDVTTFSWSETHHLAYVAMNLTYLNALYNARGKCNDAAWRIFAKGEVRLKGITGAAKGLYTFPLTFLFEASHNVSNLSIGDITGIAKEGWAYLWTLYEDQEDATAKALVKRPKAVYVERVHEYTDFIALGLVDPWS